MSTETSITNTPDTLESGYLWKNSPLSFIKDKLSKLFYPTHKMINGIPVHSYTAQVKPSVLCNISKTADGKWVAETEFIADDGERITIRHGAYSTLEDMYEDSLSCEPIREKTAYVLRK